MLERFTLRSDACTGRGKIKRLRHWLWSSRQLLRESQQRGRMYRHSPRCDHCFRSSRPRQHLAALVGFFGSGCPLGCPSKHITQPTSDWLSIRMPTLSAIDARNLNMKFTIVKTHDRCNRHFFLSEAQIDHTLLKPLHLRRCENAEIAVIHTFSTRILEFRLVLPGEPNEYLDGAGLLAHLCSHRLA